MGTIWAKKISDTALQEVMDRAVDHDRPTAIKCYESTNKAEAGRMVPRMVDYTLVGEFYKSCNLIFVLVHFGKIAINDDVHLRLSNMFSEMTTSLPKKHMNFAEQKLWVN